MDSWVKALSALDMCLALLFVASAIALLKRSLRRKAAWLALLAFIGFVALGLATVPLAERAAKEAGYPDAKTKSQADRAEEAAREKADQAAELAKESAKAAEEATWRKRALAAGLVVAAVKRGLNDPDSLQWDDLHSNEDGTVVCAEFRARNVFGGMVRKYLTVTPTHSSESVAEWNKHCTGNGFFDQNHVL
ncbi:MAG: hypothetical protein ACLPSW_04650 [Roseiarcus sp.]